MKLISAIITIIITCAILENFLPWWTIAPLTFFICYLFRLKWPHAFASGFLALFVLWAGMAFFVDSGNEHILSNRISILILHSVNPIAIVAITGIIGGLVAGFAGMTGAFLRKRA